MFAANKHVFSSQEQGNRINLNVQQWWMNNEDVVHTMNHIQSLKEKIKGQACPKDELPKWLLSVQPKNHTNSKGRTQWILFVDLWIYIQKYVKKNSKKKRLLIWEMENMGEVGGRRHMICWRENRERGKWCSYVLINIVMPRSHVPPKPTRTLSPVCKSKELLFLHKFANSNSPSVQYIGVIREPRTYWGGFL